MPHEQPRFDELVAQSKTLHQHGADREKPVAVGVDVDARAIRDRIPALFYGAVGPERRIRFVGDQAVGRQRRVPRHDAAGGGKLVRNRVYRAAAGLHDAPNVAAGIVEIQQLPGRFDRERGDEVAGVEQCFKAVSAVAVVDGCE